MAAPFESHKLHVTLYFPKIMTLIIALALVRIVRGEPMDIIVAKDGSGHFSKIAEAVSAAPNHSARKFYIKIKAGTYVERIHIGMEKTNLAFIGDGMDVTIITYNRSNHTGYNIIESATVDIEGGGFIAKGITFINSAGPNNRQAVALKSSSNLSAFHQCRFQGYQDTLFADSGVQYYRDSEIFGSTDFIFGNAAVIFQNCGIYVRNPPMDHTCVLTAQARENSGVITGIALHNCTITAAEDFKRNSGTKTYLGRPWSSLSTVVIMQSFLDDLVDPEGWLKWNSINSSLSSLYYGEYRNRGPGASTGKRVNWKGFRVMNFPEAEKFTVRNFIRGETWIPSTNIPFLPDLY